MPQDITFKRDSESLIYRENPLDAYVRRISGAGNEKNSYSIPYAEPEAEGYTFIGWNVDPDADEGYSSFAFSPHAGIASAANKNRGKYFNIFIYLQF